MSLNVYLYGIRHEIECECPKCGHFHKETVRDLHYEANITHNLWKMAEETGIYMEIWRPDEIRITVARQLIVPLREGLALLCADPDRFLRYNPENGWGSYDGLIKFTRKYMEACLEYPKDTVEVSR